MPAYLSENDFAVIDIADLAKGEIGYFFVHETVPVFAVEDRTGARYFIDLGGSVPLSAWDPGMQRASVARVSAWRFEFDPKSVRSGYLYDAPGCAFRSADSAGIIGSHRGIHRETPFIFGKDGSQCEPPYNQPVLLFARWRIVTGPKDDPFVIFEKDAAKTN